MSLSINTDRFTRLKQSFAGTLAPHSLPRLAEYLAADDGEINYTVSGNVEVDQAGSQERRVKCIIYGWILLLDPMTLAPVRHELDVHSSLVLVKDESELPPLEMESEGEDYIVCGVEMDVLERVEEEILLSLPAQVVNRSGLHLAHDLRTLASEVNLPGAVEMPAAVGAESKKISPFAKLAELKKK